MGLHNITGQKLPVQMLSKSGRSVDYNTVCEIETAQAEIALQSAEKNPLKLKPTNDNATVRTVLWADNFNAKIDSDNKMINSTHMVAFQDRPLQQYNGNMMQRSKKSRKRSVEPIFQEEKGIVVNLKKEPPKTEVVVAIEEEEVTKIFNIRLCVWRLVRHLCENDQKYPKFSGWMAY